MTWIGRLLTKRRLDAEVSKELEYHLQRQLDDYMQAGLTEEEARRRLRLEFGGTEQIGEACRDARGTRWLESIFEDLRFSSRVLRKSLSFTLAAILTLALGIGANVAIFRLLDAVRLRALPVKDPQTTRDSSACRPNWLAGKSGYAICRTHKSDMGAAPRYPTGTLGSVGLGKQ